MNEKIKKIFNERLKELMQDKDLNTVSLSKATGIPSSSISNWIQMRRTVQVEFLVILADFFDVTTDYLLGREN